ncbi:MAG: hypothetical protein N5P05_004221 (plasmid) [Chroococcopsis gigantea SAG 12.99]|jgi:hypothetical protein|nr:hypothetical protein [Chroococcopsis gigantea SAG 12.99]
MSQYPYILCPQKIEAIATSNPPIQPLQLVTNPARPIIPPEPQPPLENFWLNILLWFRPFLYSPNRRFPYFPDLHLWVIGVTTASAVLVSLGMGKIGLSVLLLFLIPLCGLTLWFFASGFVYRQTRNLYYFYERLLYHRPRKHGEYQEQLNEWRKQKDEIEEKYRLKVERINADNQRRREEHELQKLLILSKENVRQWRENQRRSIVENLNPVPLGEKVDTHDFDPRGYAELSHNCNFPIRLKHYFPNKIFALRYLSGSDRIPDFAYIDGSLFIDIEIDEPYTPRQYPDSDRSLKLTHCMGQSSYDMRDITFTNSNWFVIHFSEGQALQQPEACCKEIAKLIAYCTGDTSILSQFATVPDLTIDRRWTFEEAQDMAERRARLNYSYSR